MAGSNIAGNFLGINWEFSSDSATETAGFVSGAGFTGMFILYNVADAVTSADITDVTGVIIRCTSLELELVLTVDKDSGFGADTDLTDVGDFDATNEVSMHFGHLHFVAIGASNALSGGTRIDAVAEETDFLNVVDFTLVVLSVGFVGATCFVDDDFPFGSTVAGLKSLCI
jgi:hypothetical protein